MTVFSELVYIFQGYADCVDCAALDPITEPKTQYNQRADDWLLCCIGSCTKSKDDFLEKCVSVCFTIGVISIMSKITLGKQGFILSYTSRY